MAFFADVPVAKPNPVFMLSDLYKADTSALRLNLGVGGERTTAEHWATLEGSLRGRGGVWMGALNCG